MRWTLRNTEHLTVYIYDDTGSPIGMKYRTSAYAVGVFDTYFFEKNLQGDIIAIYDQYGSQIGTYKYDAWGALTWSCASGTSAFEYSLVYNLNPFRYRGYIYDFETGLYYLQSRYYNPNWGRFLNADGILNGNGDIIGYNLYAYCSNNPIMGYDPFGEWNWGSFISAVVVVAVATATVALAVATMGTALGVAAPVVTAAVKMSIVGGVLAGVTEVANQIAEEGEVKDIDAVYSETMTGGAEAAVDSITGGASKFVNLMATGLTSVAMSSAYDFSNGSSDSFLEALNENGQDHIVKTAIFWAGDALIGKDNTERLFNLMDILLPGRS